MSSGNADDFFEFADSRELEALMSKHPDELSEVLTYFWLDLFDNNQWPALDKPFEWWATAFREVV
jgi:hypothetical protein